MHRRSEKNKNMFDLYHDPLKDLRDFAHLNRDALQNASLLLGGQPALKQTQSVLVDLSFAPTLTRRMARELAKLHDLLTLQNVHDPDGIEAALFADIGSASPVVEDICLLSDDLEDLLRELDVSRTAQDTEPFTLPHDVDDSSNTPAWEGV